MNYFVKLTLGDWSNDGHGKYKEYNYISNYEVSKIREAYKKSCKLTGLSFNDNENYTGRELKHGSWRKIWTEYQSYEIKENAIEVLNKHGINLCEIYGNDIYIDFECVLDESQAADLIMKFISLSMPIDWIYELEENKYENINGYNTGLDEQFGYGLFD